MLNKFSNLRTKFLVLALPPIAIIIVLLAVAFSVLIYRSTKADLIAKLDYLASNQQAALSELVWSDDPDIVERIVRTMALDTDVLGVKIIDCFGDILSEYGQTDPRTSSPELYRRVPILFTASQADSRNGYLIILFNDATIWDAVNNQILRDVAASILLITIIMLSVIMAHWVVIDRPLKMILPLIRNLKGRGIQQSNASQVGDELKQVIRRYTKMLENVREYEDALHASQRQLKTITDNLPGAVVQISREQDSSYSVNFVSDGIQDLLGTRPQVLVDELNRWSMHIAPTDMTRLIAHLDESARTIKPTAIEMRLTTVESTSVWVHLLCRPVKSDGDRIVWDSLLLDVTEKHTLEKRLSELATIDGLTGLNNRRQFMDLARNEILRCRRHKLKITVGTIDADHFKRINDIYGHATGDYVLREFALLLREQLRDIDIIGRLGGEEFAIALVNTDLEDARILAQRLCLRVSEHLIVHGEQQFNFTVSIGISEFSSQEDDISRLLKRADKALNHAKNTSRNCVVADIDIPISTELEAFHPSNVPLASKPL